MYHHTDAHMNQIVTNNTFVYVHCATCTCTCIIIYILYTSTYFKQTYSYCISNFFCYFRWWNCVLCGEIFQRQVPGQLFHQWKASVPTLGPHGQGECVCHRRSQVWSSSPYSPMAQARRLQNWYCMFKRFFFIILDFSLNLWIS